MMFFTIGKQIGLLSLIFTICTISALAQVEWRPVSPAELAMTTPQVEPDADAEAIFWEIRLDDKKRTKLSYDHYVRVKIFTERGRELFSKFDIPFIKGKKVEDVAARVIKADGTIVELQPGDIFEREIISTRKIKIKAKSFAVPGIEPGAIVEYQYKEVFKGDTLSGEQLYFQRDIPMQRVVYYLRPYRQGNISIIFNNMDSIKFIKQSDGFYVGSLTNVPAYKEEPYMPPEDETKKWAVVSNNYSSFNWRTFGTYFGSYFNDFIKADRSIKEKAAQLTTNAATQEEKLKAIFDYCRYQIRNVSYDNTLTDDQREKTDNKDAEDVLKKRIGISRDVDFLFASLAAAAGFEVDLAFGGDRSENYFNPDQHANLSYIHPVGISVKMGNDRQYFSPGTPYKSFGMLNWYEESVFVMITNSGGYLWKKPPLSAPSDSLEKRSGKFVLSDDGTLEGKIRIEYTGHQATSRRRQSYNDSAAKREEDIKEEVKNHITAAEVLSISIENFDQTDKPLIYNYKITVPNYAQKTGKRIFVQPNVFEYGERPLFSAAERKYRIHFPYPWSVKDEIELTLPDGYEFENLEIPGDISDSGKISNQSIDVNANREKNEIIYKRDFYFGNNGNIFFPADAYLPLKDLFDRFHEANTTAITLKQK